MLKVGDSASLTQVFHQSKVAQFAELSLDHNPVHLDPEFASQTIFGKPIVHGFLVGSLISSVISSRLPGPGSIYMSQTLKFLKPVFVGEEITARVEVIDLPKPSVCLLRTRCLNSRNEEVIDGEARIKILPPPPSDGS